MTRTVGIQNIREYRSMCHNTLARVILFNAKRGGEAGRMTIEDYKSELSTETEGFELTPFEVKLCER